MNEFLFFISFSACVFGVIITAGGFLVQYAGTMILQVLLSFVFGKYMVISEVATSIRSQK